MYKVIALVVVLATLASAVPVPEPEPQPEPGYYNKYGTYIPTAEDFNNPASPFFNPNYPYYDPRISPLAYYSYNQFSSQYDPFTGLPNYTPFSISAYTRRYY